MIPAHEGDSAGCERCPRCQLRDGLADVIGDEWGEQRQQLLDQLLDTVERLRAVDVADDDERDDAARDAVAEVLELVDCIAGLAVGDDDAD